GLPTQPLGDIARVGPGALGQLLRGRRGLGQAAVQPHPVPDDHVPGGDRGTEIGDELTEEFLQLVLVDAHDGLLSVVDAVSLRRRRLRLRQRSVKTAKPESATWIYSEAMLQVRLLGTVAAERD